MPVSQKPRKPRKKPAPASQPSGATSAATYRTITASGPWSRPLVKAVLKKKGYDLSSALKLNLACGQTKLDGYVGVDVASGEHVDVVHDLLTFPWPFEESSVSHAYASHFLEHIPHQIGGTAQDGFFAFFDELWRVMEPEGEAHFVVPYGIGNRGMQDPTHTRYIVPDTFYYLDANWRKQMHLDHYPVRADFEIVVISGGHMHPWHMKAEGAREFAQNHYINVIADIEARLKVRKT